MLPEVQAWVNAHEEANRTYNTQREVKLEATREELNALDRNAADYHTRRYETNERFYNAVHALAIPRKEAYGAANEKLKADASLPIIGWLLDNAHEEYPNHVRVVLEALPLTRDELVTLSQEQGWCNVFNGFLRQMDAAELFGPRDPQELAQEELDQFLSDNLYHQDADRARKLASRVVDAAITKKVAETTEKPTGEMVGDVAARVATAWSALCAAAPVDIDTDQWETLFKNAVTSAFSV